MEEQKPVVDSTPEKEKEEKKVSADKEESKKIEELKKKLEEYDQLRKVYLDGLQRARADFLNYKKEELERAGKLIDFACEGLILKILPILDNFEIVEKKLPEDLKNDEKVKGILQIKAQIEDFLESQGLEQVECLGKKFDPNIHEVVEEVNSEGKEPGTIVEEIQKGYILNGRLLRPAKVKVSK